MFWFGVYVSAATAVALFVYLTAVRFQADLVGASEHPVLTAVLTGMLWPALLVGVVELSLIWLCGDGQSASPTGTRVRVVSAVWCGEGRTRR